MELMEHTQYSFSIFLVTVLVTVSVFIEPSRAAQLPLPPVPTLVPVPPLAPLPPVPPLVPPVPPLVPPVPPLVPPLPPLVPPLPPLAPLPPAPLLHPPPLPVLPPTPLPDLPELPPVPLPDLPELPPVPLPHPPLLPPVPLPQYPPLPSVPVPSPPDTPCYPALLTCKSINDTSDPSPMCCQNMEAVYKNGTDCICKVLKSSELSSDLGLNAADISNMLLECKITDKSISLCASSAPPPSNAKILRAVPSMGTIIVALMYFALN